jgi:23S rRNA pseudouridine1911/1915/1917 synthase
VKPAEKSPQAPLEDFECEVDEELRPLTVSAALRQLTGCTWSRARDCVSSGKLLLDQTVVRDPACRVGAARTLSLRMNARSVSRPASGARIGRDCLVHVDSQLVVASKPAGLSSVPFDEKERGTFSQQLEQLLGGRPLQTVHRLDKDTSGLLVFARNANAAKKLAQQFRFHSVRRKYQALVHGTIESRTIRSALVLDRGDGLRGSQRSPRHSEDAKEAITHVRVIRSFEGAGWSASWIECELETGRTHQIRIHLSEAGHPLLGEKLYVREHRPDPSPRLQAPRQMLHAGELGLRHPQSAVDLSWQVPLPRDFTEILDRLVL